MKPANGLDDVLELSYSRSLPIPDAFYSCSFYLQVQPASIEKGQELLIPGEEVQTFLIEMRAAFIFCTDKIMGHIQILEVYGESVKAWLEVSRTIQGAKWEYSGEVEFKRASLPK